MNHSKVSSFCDFVCVCVYLKMEFPHLGTHCSKNGCNKLDFLPIRCDACNQTFCNEHYNYVNHNCPNSYKKNNQVPVCPLCNIPIPVGRGQQPDIVVGSHIDNDCLSDPAKNQRRKVFTNRCSVKKCKTKELMEVTCNECGLNYCLKHRHPSDHQCKGPCRPTTFSCRNRIQGNLDEDEALAKALALSLQDNKPVHDKQKQEELDFRLAMQIQGAQTTTTERERHRERCSVS